MSESALSKAPNLVMLSAASLFSLPVASDGLRTDLSFTPDLLSVEVKENERDMVREARFKSGLGIKLRNELLQISVDYKLQSRLGKSSKKAAVSQQLSGSLYSAALNRLLGLDADIRAGSTIKAGGDAYLYSITPGVSRSLAELGDFSLRYVYVLDKAGAKAIDKEKLGYRMGLDGSTADGRLTWKGSYRTTDVYGGVEQVKSTELLEFESRFQLVPALQLQVSGRSKDETRFQGGAENDIHTETRYGAGLAWAPSPQYSVALKVNRLDESRARDDEVFGSGTVSWFPRQNMEFTFSYGDHLVEGARGVMFSTRIDLKDS